VLGLLASGGVSGGGLSSWRWRIGRRRRSGPCRNRDAPDPAISALTLRLLSTAWSVANIPTASGLHRRIRGDPVLDEVYHRDQLQKYVRLMTSRMLGRDQQ